MYDECYRGEDVGVTKEARSLGRTDGRHDLTCLTFRP